MLLRVISAEWELYRGDVLKVLLPTESGILGILPAHMNLVTPLIAGEILYLPSDAPTSALDSFADHTHSLTVWWWLAMIEDDVVTIAAE